VANLVLDGADGIVLGSETFRGKFPVASVETVLAICRQAELCFDSHGYYNSVMDFSGYHSINPNISKVGGCGCEARRAGPHRLLLGAGLLSLGRPLNARCSCTSCCCALQTEALATAAVRAATKLQAALIVVFTVTGRTANLIAKYRPRQPILTVRVADSAAAEARQAARRGAARASLCGDWIGVHAQQQQQQQQQQRGQRARGSTRRTAGATTREAVAGGGCAMVCPCV
jgi:pyruvate kinase